MSNITRLIEYLLYPAGSVRKLLPYNLSCLSVLESAFINTGVANETRSFLKDFKGFLNIYGESWGLGKFSDLK